ncbi:MAG: 4Fe-4S ferredoxin, partial [Gammaproteobacteria bacterium]|nr:4Fe-4S ferredoxin [Gammaproteobacteria bacterium]
ALLCRRLYGRYIAPVSEHLDERIIDIEAGNFDAEIEKLKTATEKELRRKYAERDMEPALEQQWE